MTENSAEEETEGTPPDKPSSNWGDLKTRVLSAIVIAPVGYAAIHFGGGVFEILNLALAIIMASEWVHLAFKEDAKKLEGIHVLVSGGAISGVAFVSPYLALVILLLGLIPVFILARSQNLSPLWAVGGVLYTTVPLLAVLWLRDLPEIGYWVVLGLVLVVVAVDVGAYAAGRLIGGPKIWPAISPSKTWAGFFGGALLAVIVANVFCSYAGMLSPIEATIAGIFTAIVAQTGDFFESWMKRYFKAKDSGTILPGHGGVLDRFDGLIFAILGTSFILWILL